MEDTNKNVISHWKKKKKKKKQYKKTSAEFISEATVALNAAVE